MGTAEEFSFAVPNFFLTFSYFHARITLPPRGVLFRV